MLLHVTKAEYAGEYKLRLKFNNGAQGIVDLEPELYGEVFEPLRDKAVFKQFVLTSRTDEWPTGADFAPEFLLEAAGLAPALASASYRTSTTQGASAEVAIHESAEPYTTPARETEES